jgi:hypothetical protein
MANLVGFQRPNHDANYLIKPTQVGLGDDAVSI